MSSELICPDCGGIIGGSPTDSAGACTCFSSGKTATSSDTVIEKVPAPQAKICCQCGKDLNGKKRLRDSRGYWCYACHKLDQEANKPKGEKCADCRRVVASTALSEFDGRMICNACRNDRKEAAIAERKRSGVSSENFKQHDRTKLMWMFAVVAVLLGIIILKHFRIIGS